MLEPCHELLLSLRQAWLGWRRKYFRHSTATTMCRRVRRSLAFPLSLLHQGNVMYLQVFPAAHRASTTC